MNPIWIVYGSSGEYSDHREWSVCAYPTEELANQHASLAQARAADLFRRDRGRLQIPEGANEYDSLMTSYDGDVEYSVFKLELREKIPVV